MTQTKTGIVAVVDDDRAVLDSLKFLLEVVGYTVLTYDGAHAFLNDKGSGRSCLILDHHMPRMTGLELAEALRVADDKIPILLITGSPSPAIVARAAQLGVERVLEKPPDEDDLLRFVNAHIHLGSGGK
jgi:two-component system, LuxR family, response regulator FixJ